MAGTDLLSALMGIQERPTDNPYGVAATGIAQASPLLVNPYASAGSNALNVLGSTLLSSVLAGLAKNESDSTNQELFPLAQQYIGGDEATRAKLIEQEPRLSKLAGLGFMEQMNKAEEARKQTAELEKIRETAKYRPMSAGQRQLDIMDSAAKDPRAAEILSRWMTGNVIKPDEMTYVNSNYPGVMGTNAGQVARGGAAIQAQHRMDFGDHTALRGLGLEDPNRPLKTLEGSDMPYVSKKDIGMINDLADSTQLGIQNLERLKAVYKKFGTAESIMAASEDDMAELGGAIQAAKDARDQTMALLKSSNPAWTGVLSEEKAKQLENLLPPELVTEANSSPAALKQALTNMNPAFLEARVNELERELLHRSGTILKNRGLGFKDSIAGIDVVAYPTEGLGQVPFGASPYREQSQTASSIITRTLRDGTTIKVRDLGGGNYEAVE